MSEKYSNRTCKTCAVLLYETSGYQQKLVNIQKKLYGFEDDVELDFIKEMEQAKEMPRVEAKIEDFDETFVSIKEERLEESDHSYNYVPDDDERVYSDFDAQPAQDSDSEDYFATSDKKPPAAKSKIVQAGTTAKFNRYTDEQLENAIHAVLNDDMTVCEASRKFNIPRTTLSRQIKTFHAEVYESDSDDNSPTTSKAANRTKSSGYSEQQLENAVHAVLREGLQIMEAARKFDVPRQTLSHRITKYNERGNESDSDDSPLKPAKVAKRSEVSMSSDSTAISNRYTEEQLEKAVRAVVEDGGRVMETAKKFNVPRQTLTHRIKHGPPKPKLFKMVQKPFKEKKSPGRGVLGMRRKGILSTDPLFCDLCNFSTFSKNDLVVHMTLGHKFGFTCKKCQAKFPTKDSLKEHRAKMHTEFHCPHCNIDFDNRRPWSTHMVRHRRFYTCEICGIQVQSHKYKYHVESHSSERIMCTALDCDKFFKSKAGLDYHLNNFHTTPATETCPICGSSYSNQKKLKRHLARMHATPNICCTVPGCSYRSTRKEYVAMHMAKHNDIDEYTKMELVRVFKATRINNNNAPKIYEKAMKEESQ